MERVRISLTTGIALAVITINAIVLPALYFGLSLVVSHSHTNLFIQHVRTLSRNLADQLELGKEELSEPSVKDALDSIMLNGDGVFAELLDDGHAIDSELNLPAVRWPGHQDFEFDTGPPHYYFIALPVARTGHQMELRLGFDENPTIAQIDTAKHQTLWALSAYLAAAVTVAILAAGRLARPTIRLQTIARRIASGDYVQSLRLETGLRELHELGGNLENMRQALVGTHERLREEMQQRERAEDLRHRLEERLRHRQRLETVGTLAGGVAHEFNNVLLPIVLMAESALADLQGNEVVRQDLLEVLASAHRAKQVVEKILTFSRSAGAPHLELLNIEPIVREALRLFNVLIPASVEVRTEFSAPLPPIRADAALLIQLIMNLCTNAYQALEGSAGIITIALWRGPAPGAEEAAATASDHVILSVGDNGVGMDAATLARIFEPFYTTRGVGVGTGLGLSVVHGIAEGFGAAITVNSAPGAGTTFTVCFPIPADTGERATSDALGGVPA